MKNFLLIVIAQIKRIIKTPQVVVSFLVMPVFMFSIVFFVNYLEYRKSAKELEKQKADNSILIDSEYSVKIPQTLGYYSESTDDLWKKFIKGGTKFESIEEAHKSLKNKSVSAVFVIPNDFTDKLTNGIKPELKTMISESGTISENGLTRLNSSINNFLLDNFVKKHTQGKTLKDFSGDNISVQYKKEKSESMINLGLKMITLFILYLILFGSSSMASDFITFRETKMLTRAIASPNSQFVIVASQILAFVICQVGINVILFFLATSFAKMEIAGFGIIFLTVVLTSVFALSLAIVMSRIFNKKNQMGIVSNITTVITIIFFFLGLISIAPMTGISQTIKNVAVISPLYWLMDMLDKEKLFPNLPIVLGMIGVLILAGSWKLKKFNNAE